MPTLSDIADLTLASRTVAVVCAGRVEGYLNRWFLDRLFGRGSPVHMIAFQGDLLEPALVEA